MLSFHDLEIKFGAVLAMHCLTEIEKAARIPSWTMIEVDPETRLANAIIAQDSFAGSAALLAA